MANNLESLELEEISLVTFPANAETSPKTGRKIPRATVALRKRDSRYLSRDEIIAHMDQVEKSRRREKDDPGTQDVDTGEPTSGEMSSASIPGWLPGKKKSKKGNKQMKKREIFQSVLKSATSSNRRAKIVEAVQMEARRIANKRGISVQKAEAEVWRANDAAVKAYDAAPVPNKLEQQTQTVKLTPSEVELHRRARKLMKSTVGLSYAQACSKALEDSPELYRQYTVEAASGKFLDVPETFHSANDVVKSDSDDEDECENCGADVDPEAKYCGNCGKRL